MSDNPDNKTPPEVPAPAEPKSAETNPNSNQTNTMKEPDPTSNPPEVPAPAEPKSAEPNEQKSASELLDALKSVQTRLGVNTGKPGMPPDPSSADPNLKSQDVVQPKQAAQLSDKAETVAALVGGQTPKPPGTPGKPKSKPKSNKFTFRGDDDLLYAISAYAIAAGVDESEAARRLIEEGLGKTHIVITPKSPPQLLEFFAGALKAWSRDFAVIKSRLNVPMPATKDKDLIAMVTNWRSIASELQALVPTLIESTQALADVLTGLDAEKIGSLRNRHSLLMKWIASRKAILAKGGLPEKEVAAQESTVEQYIVLKSLIEDLGIIKPEDIK